jgi:hypothetical protein
LENLAGLEEAYQFSPSFTGTAVSQRPSSHSKFRFLGALFRQFRLHLQTCGTGAALVAINAQNLFSLRRCGGGLPRFD